MARTYKIGDAVSLTSIKELEEYERQRLADSLWPGGEAPKNLISEAFPLEIPLSLGDKGVVTAGPDSVGMLLVRFEPKRISTRSVNHQAISITVSSEMVEPA